MFGNWVWAHAGLVFNQDKHPDPITIFSFGFTYLPGWLIDECVCEGMSDWSYPTVDKRVSEFAVKHGIPIRLVEEAQPKHTNW